MAKEETKLSDVPSEYKRRVVLRLNEEDLPEIKNWEVGKKYELKIVAKQISKSEGDPYGYNESEKKKPKVEASFEIIEVEPLEEDDDDMKGLDSATRKKAKEIGEKLYG